MISIVLVIIALGQFIYFGSNIFTFLILVLLGMIAGFLVGPVKQRTRTADNVALLTQIERNRYYSPYKNKE